MNSGYDLNVSFHSLSQKYALRQRFRYMSYLEGTGPAHECGEVTQDRKAVVTGCQWVTYFNRQAELTLVGKFWETFKGYSTGGDRDLEYFYINA